MMFPRVVFFHARHMKGEYVAWALEQMATAEAVVLDWNDEARAGWAPDGLTPGQWLKRRKPGIKLLAYIPASYWWSAPTMSAATAPHRVAVQKQMWAKGWWATGIDGELIEPWKDQPLLTRDGVEWLGDYIREKFNASYWDGIHLDVLVAEWWHLGAPRDLSEQLLLACTGLVQKLKGIAVQGNGAWAPSREDFKAPSPYAGLIAGPMVEKFPQGRWYDGVTPGGRPPADEAWAWHMALAEGWQGQGENWYAFHSDGLTDHGYFGRWVKGDQQARRFVLASACLAGVMYTPPIHSAPHHVDEMLVSQGATTWQPEGAGWLGQPAGKRFAAEHGLQVRVFERGAVVVNPTTLAASITLAPGVYRKVAGWYDKAHNDGQAATTLTVGPMDAYLLWRVGEAVEPEPDPHPNPLPEGEGLAGVVAGILDELDKMASDLARTERRLEGLERAVQGMVTGWGER